MGLSLFPLIISLVIILFFPYIILARMTVTVDQSGYGEYKTIQEAIDSAPEHDTRWYTIKINPGIYNEKISIPPEKEYIYLRGHDAVKPIITSDNHISSESATFRSSANYVVAKNIKFVNSYNINQKTTIMAASSAAIYGNKTVFYNCEFIGYKNTIIDSKGIHYYKSCYIEGAIEIILGWGQSVFEDCKINVTGEPNSIGYITAQGRESAEDSNGFVFLKCDVNGTGQAYLGKAFGTYSRVVFIQSNLSSVVIPAGWDAWVHKGEEWRLTYVEAECLGSGANSPQRVQWAWIMGYKAYLEKYSTQNFIDNDGWIAGTSLP